MKNIKINFFLKKENGKRTQPTQETSLKGSHKALTTTDSWPPTSGLQPGILAAVFGRSDRSWRPPGGG